MKINLSEKVRDYHVNVQYNTTESNTEKKNKSCEWSQRIISVHCVKDEEEGRGSANGTRVVQWTENHEMWPSWNQKKNWDTEKGGDHRRRWERSQSGGVKLPTSTSHRLFWFFPPTNFRRKIKVVSFFMVLVSVQHFNKMNQCIKYITTKAKFPRSDLEQVLFSWVRAAQTNDSSYLYLLHCCLMIALRLTASTQDFSSSFYKAGAGPPRPPTVLTHSTGHCFFFIGQNFQLLSFFLHQTYERHDEAAIWRRPGSVILNKPVISRLLSGPPEISAPLSQIRGN